MEQKRKPSRAAMREMIAQVAALMRTPPMQAEVASHAARLGAMPTDERADARYELSRRLMIALTKQRALSAHRAVMLATAFGRAVDRRLPEAPDA